jgi:hypothetical protein
MQSAYDIFLIIIVILKIILVISSLRLAIYKQTSSSDTYNINKMTYRNEIMSVITEALMFILLIVVFYPPRKTGNANNAVIISGHEKIIFFTLGVIGLLNLDWSVLWSN